MDMDFLKLLIVFAIIIVSMVLHEMAHAYTAYFLGDNTAKEEGRLSPNPLVHLDPWMSVLLPLLLFMSGAPIFGGAKPVPIDRRNLKGGAWGMALVAIAGPLTNFLIALLAFLIAHFTGLLYNNSYPGFIVAQIVIANLGFFIFNLIPIPPLDGSRVLYAIAPDGVRTFMEMTEGTTGIFIVFMLVFFFSNFISGFIYDVMQSIIAFFSWLVGM